MGSSFAQALKVARPDVVVVGSDPNPVVVRKALDREVVASANTDLSVVEMAEVVVVAAPINALREVFAQIALKPPGAPVTDMARRLERDLTEHPADRKSTRLNSSPDQI